MALKYGHGLNDMMEGWYRQSPQNRKIYDLWSNMLRKCYPKQKLDQLEIFKGVTVCERWKTLSHFVEDLPKLRGYNDYIKYINGDIVTRIHFVIEKPEFSPESAYFSCKGQRRRWVAQEDNLG